MRGALIDVAGRVIPAGSASACGAVAGYMVNLKGLSGRRLRIGRFWRLQRLSFGVVAPVGGLDGLGWFGRIGCVMKGSETMRVETLAQWIVQKGIRKAATATAFVMAWAWVQSEHDDPIDEAIFIDAYGMGLRTYYRKLSLFREVFPAFSLPGELIARAELEFGDGLRWVDLPHDAVPVAA